MHIKYLISNLLHLSKSASFVLVALFSCITCNQAFAYQQEDVIIEYFFDGPPTSTSGGSSTTGTGK